MPSQACKDLLNAITEVIGSAEYKLDLTSLYNTDPDVHISSYPNGRFQKAIAKGLAAIAAKNKTPLVRFLFGAPGNAWGLGMPKSARDWLSETIQMANTPINFPIYFNIVQNTPFSWNHSKMIVADDRRAITGGHNFWDADYMVNGVHDVSGLYEGPAARSARLFADKLWSSKSLLCVCASQGKTTAVLPSKARHPVPIPSTGAVGALETLSLGKLGLGFGAFSPTSDATKTARIVALCDAKSTIRISQQTLGGSIHHDGGGVLLYGIDFSTLLAIVRAVFAGVKVQIIVSNKTKNYEGGPISLVRGVRETHIRKLCQ